MTLYSTEIRGVPFYSDDWVRHKSHWARIQGLLIGVVFTIAVGIWVQVALPILVSKDTRVPPHVTAVADTLGFKTVTGYPLQVSVNMVSRQKFEASLSVRYLMASQNMAGVAAYTSTQQNPCVITMPADFKIRFKEATGYATFDNPFTAEILAHEFLHCFYGKWHEPWDVIQQATK